MGWHDQHFHTLTDCLHVFGFLSRAKISNQIPEQDGLGCPSGSEVLL